MATFNTRWPDIQRITSKHCRAMKRVDPQIAKVFLEPNLIAYKRLLRFQPGGGTGSGETRDKKQNYKIKAKQGPQLPTEIPTRHKKCKKLFCESCPCIKRVREISHNNRTLKVLQELNCWSFYCIHLIECDKKLHWGDKIKH